MGEQTTSFIGLPIPSKLTLAAYFSINAGLGKYCLRFLIWYNSLTIYSCEKSKLNNSSKIYTKLFPSILVHHIEEQLVRL